MPPTTKWSHYTKVLKWQGAPSLPRDPGVGVTGNGEVEAQLFLPREEKEGGSRFTCLSNGSSTGHLQPLKRRSTRARHPPGLPDPGWDPGLLLGSVSLASQGGEGRACDCQDSRPRRGWIGQESRASSSSRGSPTSSPSSPANLRATSRNPSVAVSHGHRGSPWRRGWGPWC